MGLLHGILCSVLVLTAVGCAFGDSSASSQAPALVNPPVIGESIAVYVRPEVERVAESGLPCLSQSEYAAAVEQILVQSGFFKRSVHMAQADFHVASNIVRCETSGIVRKSADLEVNYLLYSAVSHQLIFDTTFTTRASCFRLMRRECAETAFAKAFDQNVREFSWLLARVPEMLAKFSNRRAQRQQANTHTINRLRSLTNLLSTEHEFLGFDWQLRDVFLGLWGISRISKDAENSTYVIGSADLMKLSLIEVLDYDDDVEVHYQKLLQARATEGSTVSRPAAIGRHLALRADATSFTLTPTGLRPSTSHTLCKLVFNNGLLQAIEWY